MSEKVPIDQIKITDRVRKDLGDIQSLAESIQRLGQLQPVGIDTENRLLFGERRIAALKSLGAVEVWAERFTDLDSALSRLQAESDENTERKSFTPEELVLQGRRLLPLEQEAAAQRRSEAAKRGVQNRVARRAGTLDGSVTFTEPSESPPKSPPARDRVGVTLGVSGVTYDRARKVVDAAEKDPALRPIVDEMNQTGNVCGSYNKMMRTTGRGGHPTGAVKGGKKMPKTKSPPPTKRPKVLALEGFETLIESKMEAFLDVAHALFQIREQRLYTEQYGEFPRYLKARWGVSFRMGRSVTCALDGLGFVQGLKEKENDHAR